MVLLTGNGHARKDVGVPFWLSAAERASTVSIGMLERGGAGDGALPADDFDAYVVTGRAERPDPCVDLAKHLRPAAHQPEVPSAVVR